MVFLLPVEPLCFVKVFKSSETSVVLRSNVLQTDFGPHKGSVLFNTCSHKFDAISLLRPQWLEEISPPLRVQLVKRSWSCKSNQRFVTVAKLTGLTEELQGDDIEVEDILKIENQDILKLCIVTKHSAHFLELG